MECSFEIGMLIFCQRNEYLIGVLLVHLEFAAEVPSMFVILALMLSNKVMIIINNFQLQFSMFFLIEKLRKVAIDYK